MADLALICCTLLHYLCVLNYFVTFTENTVNPGLSAAMWPYQLTRRSLTRVSCSVYTHWQTVSGDCLYCCLQKEHGRSAGKDVDTETCVVKRFRGRIACIGLPSTSTTYGLTGQAATTRTVAITRPHLNLTQFALYVSVPGLATHLPRRLRVGRTTRM